MAEISNNDKDIKIRGISRVSPQKSRDVTDEPPAAQDFPRRRDEGKREKPRIDEAKDHLSELQALVDWANRECEKKDSQYRFRLRVSGEEVFIDVVIADAEGRIKAIMASEITHEEVLRTVEHIREGEGILFDMKG